MSAHDLTFITIEVAFIYWILFLFSAFSAANLTMIGRNDNGLSTSIEKTE